MGRDSRFFFITEAAYKRFDDKDIYKVDLDNDEFIEGEEFVTRNNYILPYHTVVRCEMPRTSSERHVMDLVEEAIEKSAQFEDDGFHLGKALMFYGLVLEKSDNDYCYVVIHND